MTFFCFFGSLNLVQSSKKMIHLLTRSVTSGVVKSRPLHTIRYLDKEGRGREKSHKAAVRCVHDSPTHNRRSLAANAMNNAIRTQRYPLRSKAQRRPQPWLHAKLLLLRRRLAAERRRFPHYAT